MMEIHLIKFGFILDLENIFLHFSKFSRSAADLGEIRGLCREFRSKFERKMSSKGKEFIIIIIIDCGGTPTIRCAI